MVVLGIIAALFVICITIISIVNSKYRKLEAAVLEKLGFRSWNFVSYYDSYVTVKSRQTLEKYDEVRFFKENRERLIEAKNIIKRKTDISNKMRSFLNNNDFKNFFQYYRVEAKIQKIIDDSRAYRVLVTYISSAGNNLGSKNIILYATDIKEFENDPSLLMSKGEYNSYIKAQQKEILDKKHHEYYECVNSVIDYANKSIDLLIIKGSKERIDNLITQLFDRTINSIKKIKSIDSEEWTIIRDFITRIKKEIESIVLKNKKIQEYYLSSDFLKIKKTCETMMDSQREFNEYIGEKVKTVSQLFGTRVTRNETVNDDEWEYIRPYKKTISPFAIETSATVFASAENNPLEYVAKYFYPNKSLLSEQIQKLYTLVEELETLREAKQIIENYKAEYQQYLGDVPEYIMNDDEDGFYSRLGFTNIDESILVVEYKFSYTSGGGMAQRSFTVPMTEENITELIALLQSKLTAQAFAKEQRALMTRKLRESIKHRDNYTCCYCGNSTFAEPNLLLEIDHIVPIAKGGSTVENNLQTLCWKCNRSKSDKII